MKVIVTSPEIIGGAVHDVRVYSVGEVGELLLTDSNGLLIAIYAPGAWTSVRRLAEEPAR